MTKASKISRLLYTWIMLFLLWLVFTSSFAYDELIVGLALSFITAVLTFEYFTQMGLGNFSPKKMIYQLEYLIVFLIALVKSNLQMAKIVLTPSLPIKPAIVEFETKLRSDSAKMILANSITLTPGTFTVDIIDNKFYVHWLQATTTDTAEIYKEIAESFEKILLKIYE